jgi:hypothetical protein
MLNETSLLYRLVHTSILFFIVLSIIICLHLVLIICLLI